MLQQASKSTEATDGSVRLIDSNGRRFGKAMIIEGKVDWGHGGGSYPAAQLLRYYAAVVDANWDKTACQDDVYPTMGIEVFGNVLR